MKNNFKYILIAVIIISVSLTAFQAYAQAPDQCPPNSPGICLTIDMVVARLQFLACWFGTIAVLLIIIMMFVYGFMFMFSRDDPSKFSEAKKALGWGIIGAFVILGVYVIIATVGAAVGNANFTLPFSC